MPQPDVTPVDTLVVLDPVALPSGATTHRIVAATPGSLRLDEVATTWTRRGRSADLGDVGGPWGVVVWDAERRRFGAVTDPLGIHPLFWAPTATGGVVVGSSLAAIVDHGDVDDTMDTEGALLELLHVSKLTTGGRTPFVSVRRVPPGHVVWFAPDGTTSTERYWDPDALPGTDRSLSLDDCAALLRETVDAAVGRALPDDATPVGAHVSSGIDCTVVACRANQRLIAAGRPGLTAGYSWSPSESIIPRLPHDERSLIDAVVAREGFPVHTIDDPALGDWWWDTDPCRFPESTHALERSVLPLAQRDDIGVMLSGWGGDEFASFNGRGVMRGLVRSGRLGGVWSHVSALLEVRSGRSPSLAKRARAFAATVRDELLPGRSGSNSRWPGPDGSDAELRAISELVADTLADQFGGLNRAKDHREYQLGLLALGHLQHRTGWWYQTGRRFGLDYRFPLLDLDVVTTALTLPGSAFRSAGWNRIAYRKAVADWAPPEVVWNILKNEPASFEQSRMRRETAASSDRRRHRPRADEDAVYGELVALVASGRRESQPRDNTNILLVRPDAAPV